MAAKRGRSFQVVAEPPPQLVQFIGVGTSDLLRVDRIGSGVKQPLLDLTVLIFMPDNEANVFSLRNPGVTLENEALLLGFDKRKLTRDARKDCT